MMYWIKKVIFALKQDTKKVISEAVKFFIVWFTGDSKSRILGGGYLAQAHL